MQESGLLNIVVFLKNSYLSPVLFSPFKHTHVTVNTAEPLWPFGSNLILVVIVIVMVPPGASESFLNCCY